MRSRLPLLLILLGGSSLVLPHLAHAAIPYWGPIIPANLQSCAAGWAGLIVVANNIISFLLTATIAFVAPLMFAYGGFLYVVNPVNPSGRSHANEIMLNTVVGIVLALASWGIVDALLSVLYNGSAGGPWYSLITGTGDPCINLSGSLSQSSGATTPAGGGNVTPSGGNATLPTNANCTPSTISQAAAAGGYTLTPSQAQTLSCIAVPESSCNNNPPVAHQPDGTPTTASGMFQVVLGANDVCHNLNLSVCTQAAQAAGWTGSGNLNCSSAYSGGHVKAGMENLANFCHAAATNINCNASAAACIIQASGSHPYSAWVGDSRSSKQQQCVATFGSSPTSLSSWFSNIL